MTMTAEYQQQLSERGRIEEIQGVVIEAVFPDKLPEINHAITIKRPEAARAEDDEGIATADELLVCEVQQHLGDDRVRAVAMDTDRRSRARDRGGRHRRPDHGARRPETLGRIFNLLGEPIDLGEPVARRRRALADPPRRARRSRR